MVAALLFDDTFDHGERERFDQLMEMLKQKRPDYYAPSGIKFISMEINNALVEGRAESLSVLVHELAEVGESDIDRFNRTLSQLAYHGRPYLLLDARRTAWPKVRDSRNVVVWGIDEFAGRGIYTELFEWLEGHPYADERDVEDTQLRERILFYSGVDREDLGDAIARRKCG